MTPFYFNFDDPAPLLLGLLLVLVVVAGLAASRRWPEGK
jgi:hypothetical protein